MTAVKEIPHGKASGYTDHKCRCEGCREAKREYDKAYYAANRDRIRARVKAYQAAAPDRRRAQDKAKYEASRDRARARQREWKKRNPELVLAACRRRRAKKLDAPSAPYTAQQVKQRWSMFGNRCWLNPSHPAEATDHVKPLAAGGADMLANFRPICHSCNASKGAKWPLDLSSIALQRDTAATAAVSANNPK